MNAYRCDGCKEFFQSAPLYTIERTDGIEAFDEASEYHLCSWGCVSLVAARRIDVQLELEPTTLCLVEAREAREEGVTKGRRLYSNCDRSHAVCLFVKQHYYGFGVVSILDDDGSVRLVSADID